MSKTLESRCYYQSAKVTTRKSMLPSKCQSCHQTFKIAGRIAILRSESDAHGSLPRGDFAATGGDLLVALLGLSSTVAVELSQSTPRHLELATITLPLSSSALICQILLFL